VYSGIGIPTDRTLGVGWSMSADCGAAVYRMAQGRLRGRWTTSRQPGAFGVEVLEGPAQLGGTYQIIEGTRPGTAAAYFGTVTIFPNGQTYRVLWNLADGSRVGVGILEADTLVVGWGTGTHAGVVLYQLSGRRLSGRWAPLGSPTLGLEVLEPL
jgi:hypothetical protein